MLALAALLIGAAFLCGCLAWVIQYAIWGDEE